MGNKNIAAPEKLAELKKLVTAMHNIVFFGGAGVSTESGIPDFRGDHGIYTENYGAEEILTPGFMHAKPREFWEFYRKFFMPKGILPNAAHYKLAAWEKDGRLLGIVTQNVDNLHKLAGSQNIAALHGDGTSFYCEKCGRHYSFDEVYAMPLVPKCCHDSCDGTIRPDIVLYNESLPQGQIYLAVDMIGKADLLIIAGTSMTVYPAAGLVAYRRPDCKVCVINKGQIQGNSFADLCIDAKVGVVMAEL